MKDIDKYHKWIEWSNEDQVYIGKCPDLITGIHGEDPVALYGELCGVIEDVLNHFKSEGRVLPEPRVKPMQEIA
jgi:hypothetical protein